ncbi:MAG TPA: hypothetical protein PLD37_08870, partial [Usitatibacteraceae bacterium]|nr:hypothetical protein [Usitatibacteraceae bacterium]
SAPELPSGSGPRIDLDAARVRARDIASGGRGPATGFAIPMPAPPPHKSKEELALENSIKPECLKAYKAMGLLAIAPMVWNAFGETACRW